MRRHPASQGGVASAVRSGINVTPLVDVCLVLLIIFMVFTPLLRREIGLALPETAHPASMPEVSHQLTLSIKGDGSILVDQAWVPRERLPATLKALHDRSPSRPVVVDGDRHLHYRTVASLLRMVRDAGFERAGLATEKLK